MPHLNLFQMREIMRKLINEMYIILFSLIIIIGKTEYVKLFNCFHFVGIRTWGFNVFSTVTGLHLYFNGA